MESGEVVRNVSCWANFFVLSSSLVAVSWGGGVPGCGGSTVLGIGNGFCLA